MVAGGARARRAAIVQSNYIPWKGYFDLINLVDEFVLYDDRQYTRRDWRNRNKIKTPQGASWLTIPVEVKGRYHQRIDETRVEDAGWAERHWHTLEQTYRRAACFSEYADPVRRAYEHVAGESLLSYVNESLLRCVCDLLGIQTSLRRSTDFESAGARTERLVDICRQAGATVYLSGPAARAYIDESLFAEAGIELEYMDYSGYPEYPQLHPPFEHGVTVLDLIFNTGADAPLYMKSLAG